MAGKRCIVFSGGLFEPGSFVKKIVSGAGYIICADGGARHANALRVIPNLVLGDFDTLTPLELEELNRLGAEIIRYPADKDYTDTHLALLKALELGFVEIDILAGLGGRMDHTLANIMLLALPQGEKARIRIIDEQHEIFLVRKDETITGTTGDVISLLPLSEQVDGISTKGLHYSLSGGTFTMGIPIGVSNFFSREEAVIEIKSGLLLVIRVIKSREKDK